MFKDIQENIRKRYSCRIFKDIPLQESQLSTLSEFLSRLTKGPFGSSAQFRIIASTPDDFNALKGLGAYGSVRNEQGYIAGAIENKEQSLVEYGYLLEHAVLKATEIGIATCWIGGIFTRSRFAEKINLSSEEIMPAVIAIGYESENARRGFIRRYAKGDTRLPFESLFYSNQFGNPLTLQGAGPYGVVLEMVRLAPSASNKQPWRIICACNLWHFYLQRTRGYGKDSLLFTVLRLPDLQKVDMGIAMSHFELSARALGLKGRWIVEKPKINVLESAEYIVSWEEK